MSLVIFSLAVQDSADLSHLLLAERPEYCRYFTPFSFSEESLFERFSLANEDRYWGIRWQGRISGFFMLRGFDEGFARPSFGVFISEAFSNNGLGTLALHYSLSWCKLNGIERVMLKVHPENQYARRAYEAAGFVFIETCDRTGHLVMEKKLSGS